MQYPKPRISVGRWLKAIVFNAALITLILFGFEDGQRLFAGTIFTGIVVLSYGVALTVFLIEVFITGRFFGMELWKRERIEQERALIAADVAWGRDKLLAFAYPRYFITYHMITDSIIFLLLIQADQIMLACLSVGTTLLVLNMIIHARDRYDNSELFRDDREKYLKEIREKISKYDELLLYTNEHIETLRSRWPNVPPEESGLSEAAYKAEWLKAKITSLEKVNYNV